MPDLTLYRDDVVLIRDALAYYKTAPCSIRKTHSSRCEQLRDVLLDRLVQQLHPARERETQMELVK